MISTTQSFLFALLIVMVLIWFYLIWSFSAYMREKHPTKFKSMNLDKMFPKSRDDWQQVGPMRYRFDDSAVVSSLVKFLFSGEHRRLRDDKLTAKTIFMRRFACAYIFIFCYLCYSIFSNASIPAAPAPKIEKTKSIAYELYREDRYAEALDALNQALADNNYDPEILYWRGMTYWQLDNTKAALADFRQVSLIDSNHFKAHQRIDELLAPQGRWTEIIDSWNRYIRNNPNHAEAWFERAGTHHHNGNEGAALKDAQTACRLGLQEACGIAKRLNRG